MDKDNFFVRTQIQSSIPTISNLINSGVFNASILRVFQGPVFTEVMIKLNDLLQKLSQLGYRIDFKEDITDEKDITDLVSKMRNAVCHIDSGENLLDKENMIKFVFNIAYGRGNIASINGKTLISDYEDDICFFFGENKIYLKRHIVRCIAEAKKKVELLYNK